MDYSKITDHLYIGTTPKSKDYERLHKLGVSLVINMRIGLPPVRDPISPPLISLWLPTVDSPLIPIPLKALQKGAVAALKCDRSGGSRLHPLQSWQAPRTSHGDMHPDRTGDGSRTGDAPG